MFARKAPGIGIDSEGISVVRLTGSPASPRLGEIVRETIPPGMLQVVLHRENILDPEQFGALLQGMRQRLSLRGGPARLSVPNGTGRVMLLDVEERIGSHEEGCAILRWKLKKRLPFDCNDIHLDYQPVSRTPEGGAVMLVAVTVRRVIDQFEAVCDRAGFPLAAVELNALSVANLFSAQIRGQGDCWFLAVDSRSVSVMVFSGGCLRFIRIRELNGLADNDLPLTRELAASRSAARTLHGEAVPDKVLGIVAPDRLSVVRRVVHDTFGCEPLLLQAESTGIDMNAAPLSPAGCFASLAAFGSALGGL